MALITGKVCVGRKEKSLFSYAPSRFMKDRDTKQPGRYRHHHFASTLYHGVPSAWRGYWFYKQVSGLTRLELELPTYTDREDGRSNMTLLGYMTCRIYRKISRIKILTSYSCSVEISYAFPFCIVGRIYDIIKRLD